MFDQTWGVFLLHDCSKQISAKDLYLRNIFKKISLVRSQI